MRRIHLLASVFFMLLTVGFVLSMAGGLAAQSVTPTPEIIAFSIEGEIGRALPRKIVYDPTRERMAVVDAYSRLLLIGALDYSTQAVLHERGSYGDIAFSDDGRWLAVIYDLTVELWDTETQQRVANLVNGIGSAHSLNGPLDFSSDNAMLVFYGVYPAPPALRRTENDTIVYPWVWHLAAARGEATSTFPDEAPAVQMFDYPNGFVLTPDDRIVAALPARLRVLDAFSLQVLYEIPTARYEQDPLSIWRSLRDERVYVRPVTSDTLLQVDTTRQALVEIPMNIDLTRSDLDLIGGLEVGSIGRVIGEQAGRDTNPLLQILLGDYRHSQRYGSTPLTVTLVDLMLPPAATDDNVQALLFVYEEQQQTGRFLLTSGSAQQMVLSPNGEELLMRLYEGDEYVVRYDLTSGREINRFLPALQAIGGYSRQSKNRVLAYDQSGQTIISDFQRLDAETFSVQAEDLRYSRVFDRFFFSEDSQKIITLAGTEWREWSAATGEVLRREVINLSGEIAATSADGYRYLTLGYYNDNSGYAEVLDLNTNERYNVRFQSVEGSSISEVYPNPSWTRFLVVYSENPYGPHSPGNQIAVYDRQAGFRWLIAGDDLPPNGLRQYGWVDEETVYVYGQGRSSSQQTRVYGADYAASGLPTCIASAFPEQTDHFLALWERLLYYVRGDRLNELALRMCQQAPQSAAEVEAWVQITATPQTIAVTGVPSGEVPQCLLDRYPADANAYSQIWRTMTANASPEQASELALLLCEGIGPIPEEQEFDPSLGITMFVNAETGERSSSDYQEPAVEEVLMGPVYDLFERTEGRPLGTAILSPDRDLMAASSLPGELIIYRLIVTYDTLMSQLTATAAVELAEANLIYALPSPSATYSMIGTPRPTLTVTPRQTPFLLPVDSAYAGATTENFCPSEILFDIDNPSESYDASGRIYAIFSDGPMWQVEPEDGSRGEAEDAIQCSRGVDCQFSPDKRWILAETYDLIYVARPDNTDQRILWDLRTPNPPTPVPQNLYWSGKDTLEWEGVIPVTLEGGTPSADYGYVRDVLNVFPDPRPWSPNITINGIPAQFISRQPGGLWAVAVTTYNTGIGEGYKYYLYHTETGAYLPFAQKEGQIGIDWHPMGDRLFFTIYDNSSPVTYQLVFPQIVGERLGGYRGGVWSNDGRYRIFSTDRRDQPIAVQDSLTGDTRTYCLPETGARQYGGPFTWSPDDRYVALQAPLPRDEAQEGVGQHTMILSLETGEVVDLTTGILELISWAEEPGGYGSGDVATPTPSPTMTPAS
jgi:WD40 repeat protein